MKGLTVLVKEAVPDQRGVHHLVVVTAETGRDLFVKAYTTRRSVDEAATLLETGIDIGVRAARLAPRSMWDRLVSLFRCAADDGPG